MQAQINLNALTYPHSATFPSFQINAGTSFPRQYAQSFQKGSVVMPMDRLYTDGSFMDDGGYDTTVSKKMFQQGDGPDIAACIDYSMPVFGRVHPDTIARHQNGLLHDLPIQGMGLSALNFYLKSEAGRRKYGADTDCKKLLEDWSYQGIQMTDHTNDTKQSRSMMASLAIEGRARMPNVFLCNGKHKPRLMDRTYLVWQRERLTEIDSTSSVPNTYWRVLPLCMPGNSPVPIEWYVNYKVTGECKFLGTIQEVEKHGGAGHELKARAEAAVFPELGNPESWRKPLVDIGNVVMELNPKKKAS